MSGIETNLKNTRPRPPDLETISKRPTPRRDLDRKKLVSRPVSKPRPVARPLPLYTVARGNFAFKIHLSSMLNSLN